MHPSTLFLSLAALASVAVSTKDKDNGPRCAEDEYYNKMMESKNRKAAVTDCAKWLGETITNPNEIPKYLKDCGGGKDEDRVSRVSAACTCIETSSVSSIFSTSTHLRSTTSTTAVITTSSRTPSHLSSSSVSPTGPTSRTQSTPSSSRHSSTTSTLSSSSQPPSSSSDSTRVTSSTTSSHEVLPTVSSSPPSSHGSTSSTGTHNSVSSSIHITTTSTSAEHTTSTSPLHTSTSQSVHPSSSGTITRTFTSSTQTVLPNRQSTVTTPGSTVSSAGPSRSSTTSFTTSTIYTESIYTITSCSPGKSDCPAASTVLVTSTIAISTTICPVTETARPTTPPAQTTTRWTTTTIYSTTTSTLTRCPPGASNCPVGNLPISTVIPVSTTVLPVVDGVPTPEPGNQGGRDTKKEGAPTQSGVSDGKPDVPTSTFTVVTVPTTIHTIMNGVSAQIMTVVPVSSALGVGNNPYSAPTPSSTAGADPHAGDAQQAAAETGNSSAGRKLLSSTNEPSYPHVAPTDASFDATAWQSTEPSRSGLTWKPMLPANNTPVASSTSSRPPVVTAGATGLVGSDGTRVAFFIFALAALL